MVVIEPVREDAIGTFLLRRLREVGRAHVFGKAGDFNPKLLEQLEIIAGCISRPLQRNECRLCRRRLRPDAWVWCASHDVWHR